MKLSSVILLGLAAFLAACDRQPEAAYRLDLTPLQVIDADLVTFRQVRLVKTPVAVPIGMAGLPDAKGLVLVGDGEAVLLDGDWQSVARVSLDFRPVGVAAVEDGRIYIASERRVVVWLPHSDSPPSAWGRLPEETVICSLAATPRRIWLADPVALLVRVFDAHGAPLSVVGARDENQPPHFILPSRFFDLAAAGDGTLWAVNPGLHRLENYRPDGSYLGGWQAIGMDIAGFGGCCNPVRVAVFPDGRFATAEKGLTRVKVYDQQGQFAGVVCGADRLKDSGENLDLAVFADGRVAVLDPKAQLIRVFEPL